MQAIKNVYFKRGVGLISGINLKGPVENICFIECDFHPNTWDEKFINCCFIDCDNIEEDFTNLKKCVFWRSH